ncbi:MAG: zinc-ribbon domain-containing protein [Micavibrio aeruginosavorus]|uniref:Zinc-ribbon domain-containing protein n=1 Tax=Micavibrio aeruginosavorus TaxID=349221 RepID=A0A7T5R139_9BACT|nr:MAG: zinc-ribbon domain-containing protein [Micavibrio aeruginosavorus]
MILTCEECHTRYLLPTHMLGAAGRRVKCTICGHEWFQVPRREEDGVVQSQAPIEDSVKDGAATYELPVLSEAVHQESRVAEPFSRVKVSCFMAAIFIGMMIFAGLIVARTSVMTQWPDSVALYDAMGLAGPVPGAGLVFENMSATTSFNAEGVEILRVNGEVVNIRTHPVKVPGLRFSLRTSDGQEIESWSYDSPGADMQPTTTIPLTASYPVIGADVTELSVRFTEK